MFRVVQLDSEALAKLDGPSASVEMGAGANVVKHARYPFMCRTDSLDHSIVLSCEIYTLMDEEDIHIKPGDRPCMVKPGHRALPNHVCSE